MKSKKFKYYLFSTALFVTLSLLIIAINIDLSLLWSRYSFSSLAYMAEIRFAIYERSVSDMTFAEFWFGRPDLYLFSSYDSGSRMVNPHNLFLAIIRYNGLIPFMMFIVIFILIFFKYIQLYINHIKHQDYRVMESSILILFVIVLIYTLLSGGRITRSFAFYIVLGYAVGYFEMFKYLKTYEDYKKIIL